MFDPERPDTYLDPVLKSCQADLGKFPHGERKEDFFSMKVMTIVGTRPEIIRLSRVMAALDRYMTQIVVHTGQNYDYELDRSSYDNEIRKPDYFLEAAGATACETVGQAIARVDHVLEKETETLLVLGDTNSCLAAYAAKRRKIPVFHMEAGNRCLTSVCRRR